MENLNTLTLLELLASLVDKEHPFVGVKPKTLIEIREVGHFPYRARCLLPG